MKRRIVSIAAITVVLLSLTVGVGAITWGQPDGNDHPHVGTLLYTFNGVDWFSCTGTLLSPMVMLTAGHCVEDSGQTSLLTFVRFTEDAMAGIGDYRSVDEWLLSEWIMAAGVIPHPQFDDYSEFPLTYDVGVVILSQPVFMDQYGELPQPGFLKTLVKGKKHKDNKFTIVGYGLQGLLKPFYGDEWARYQGTVKLIELNSAHAGGASAKFSNNPGKGNGTGGACFGDSGGPLFHGDSNVIGAVVSWGHTPCVGVDYHFRMDTPAALGFVLEILTVFSP